MSLRGDIRLTVCLMYPVLSLEKGAVEEPAVWYRLWYNSVLLSLACTCQSYSRAAIDPALARLAHIWNVLARGKRGKRKKEQSKAARGMQGLPTHSLFFLVMGPAADCCFTGYEMSVPDGAAGTFGQTCRCE